VTAILAGALAFALSMATAPALAAEPLRFGLQGAAAERTLNRIWQPLLDGLATSLGRPVEAVISDDYAGVIDNLRNNRIQLAWVGNRNAIDAVDNAGAEIFSQVLNSRGVPGYYSLLIVRTDRGFDDFDDVWTERRTVRFGFGDRSSTSGTTVPLYFLFAEAERDSGDFASVRHADHEENFNDVLQGRVDVATISSVMLQRFIDRNPTAAEQVKTIWASPLIPTDPLVWRRDLSTETKRVVSQFFLQYGKPGPAKTSLQVDAERATLEKIRWAGFKASSNSQLAYVRVLTLFAELEATTTDPSLSDSDRAARIEALERQLQQTGAGTK
jgi:phosphonate transport system substrate-binding protein